jgi:HK97 family phage portal protein
VGLFDFLKREERAISFQTLWGSGAELELGTQSGTLINKQTAFEIVAFFSAVSLISDTISTLPVDAFIRIDGNRKPYRPKPAWIDQPDVDIFTRSGHYQQVLVSLLVSGNAYVRVYRDRAGDVVNLVCLNPDKVEVKRSGLGRKMFVVSGEEKPLTAEEVMHLTDLLEPGALTGVSRVEKLRDALGVASALQSYAARFFGQGATTAGIIEYPGNLTPDQAKNLREGFDSAHRGFRKAHRTGILSGGATYKQTTVNPTESQALESRRFAVEEIARVFNIPLSMMGIPGTQSYASVEQNAIQFVTHTLRPYIEKLEAAYSRLLPNTAFIKFNIDGLLRGDFNSRVTAYASALQTGWMSVNDIRRIEDLTPVDGGDQYRVPLANVNLSAAGLAEEQSKVEMAGQLIRAGFDPTDVLAKLGLPEIMHDGGVPVTLQSMAVIDPTNPVQPGQAGA